MSPARTTLLAALVCFTAWPAVAAATPPPLGGLTEIGCISESAGNGCTAGDGVANAHHVAVSSDGHNVYVASSSGGAGGAGALSAFARDPATGALTELNCVGVSAGAGCTAAGGAVTGAFGVAVSPDGATIYVTSPTYGGGSVAAFARNAATGAIGAQLDCVSETATGPCADGHGLTTAEGVTATNIAIYVAADAVTNGGLTSFSRGAVSGAVGGETACFDGIGTDGCTIAVAVRNPNSVAISPDGRTAYATSDSGVTTSWIASLLIDQTGALSVALGCVSSANHAAQGCAGVGEGFDEPSDVAVAPTPDHSVYIAAPSAGGEAYAGGIGALSVDANTGGLVGLINCVEVNGFGCAQPYSTSLNTATGIAISPDGANLYSAGQEHAVAGGGVVAAFTRNTANGAIADQIDCFAGSAGSCAPATGIGTASYLTVSPDGRNVYVGAETGGSGGGVATFARELAPACTDTTATVAGGATVAVPLTCTDPNGDPITRTIATGPASGTLGAIDQAAGTVAYTAAATPVPATATVTFSAGDGAAASAPATATITVTPAPAVIGTTPQGNPAANAAPRSAITGLHSRNHAKTLTRFAGTAADDHKVSRVEIAVLRTVGGAHAARAKHRVTARCLQLGSHGPFVASAPKRGRCAPSHWLKATGTTKWTFKLATHLARGSYTVYSRATDAAGLHESTFSAARHNRLTFTVS